MTTPESHTPEATPTPVTERGAGTEPVTEDVSGPVCETRPNPHDDREPGHEFGSVALRWLGLLGGMLAAYGIGVFALAGLNAAVWHFEGFINAHLSGAAICVALGLVGVLVARSVGRRGGVAWGVRHSVLGVISLVLGVGVFGFGAVVAGDSLWYDLTYVRQGGVGASFAILGIWFAWFFCFPLGALFLALGLGRRR